MKSYQTPETYLGIPLPTANEVGGLEYVLKFDDLQNPYAVASLIQKNDHSVATLLRKTIEIVYGQPEFENLRAEDAIAVGEIYEAGFNLILGSIGWIRFSRSNELDIANYIYRYPLLTTPRELDHKTSNRLLNIFLGEAPYFERPSDELECYDSSHAAFRDTTRYLEQADAFCELIYDEKYSILEQYDDICSVDTFILDDLYDEGSNNAFEILIQAYEQDLLDSIGSSSDNTGDS